MTHTVNHSDRSTPSILLRPDEVAEILQVTPRTVRRWGATGVLERIRLGDRLTRYTPESVEALIHPSTRTGHAGNVTGSKSAVQATGDEL